MNTLAIIAEYNPFHNGHRYLIDEARRITCADSVIAVMSGNFVQRGEAAMLNKYERAAHAIANGVDLVIELPCLYALSSAQYFAQGAIKTLLNIDGITHLAFGSECGDISVLNDALTLCAATNYNDAVRTNIDSGLSYAKACENAWISSTDIAYPLATPNNVLGLEYMRALSDIAPNITPITIKRIGDYNTIDFINDDTIASASAIRNAHANNLEYSSFVSAQVRRSLQNAPKIDTNRLFSIVATNVFNGFDNVYEDGEGLFYRVRNALKSANNYDELVELTHTKRYSKSRIRRLLLHIALGHNADLIKTPIVGARVLAVNKNRRDILSRITPIQTNALSDNDLLCNKIYEIISGVKISRHNPIFV